MDIHRGFNFDDPEDSYWNETGGSTSLNDSSNHETNNSTPARTNLDLESTTEISSAVARLSSQLVKDFELTVGLVNENQATTSERSGTSDPGLALKKYNSIESDDLRSVTSSADATTSKLSNTNSSLLEQIVQHNGAASIVSDCSLGSYSSEVTVQLDYSRLKSEHKKLQKHFETIRKERYKAIPVYEAVKRLGKCQSVSLDLYKSKQDKTNLLEAALDSLDHDIICTVVLFLKRSLTNSLFREMLILKATAAEHYVQYLREAGEHQELVDTLFALGRCDEAAMVEFSLACRKRQPEQRAQALRKCLVSGFSVPALSNECAYVEEYVNLLEGINRFSKK
uniref:Vps16 C-terminal domain-containing protein n=1 Tax=Ditylenchus dipsaci TaxID=166011 RepID=A0A915ECV5_9BILA